VLGEAFRQEYDRNSASILRIAQTALRGLATLEGPARTDPWLAIRRGQILAYAQQLRLLLPILERFAHNSLERRRAAELSQAFQRSWGHALGPRILAMGALAVAGIQTIRTAVLGNMRQPACGSPVSLARTSHGPWVWLRNLLTPGYLRKEPSGAVNS